MTERQKINFLWCGLPACTRYTAGKMPAPQNKESPPLKRRAITVCPFKGAFGNSPAFQGWDEKFRGFQLFSRFEIAIITEASTSF